MVYYCHQQYLGNPESGHQTFQKVSFNYLSIIFDLALRPGNFGALAWIASPLIGNLLLTFFWRDRHPFAGFMLAVILAALTAWGNLVDWLIWRDNGKPGEPIRFLVAGYTAWAGWGLVLVFWITGLILHRGKPVMPPPHKTSGWKISTRR